MLCSTIDKLADVPYCSIVDQVQKEASDSNYFLSGFRLDSSPRMKGVPGKYLMVP